MHTALVIAGTSFVGRHLCDRLRTDGVPLRATSRIASANHLACDLTLPGQIDAIVDSLRPRWIFQCAGGTGTSDDATLQRLHVDATGTLLGAVRRHVPDAVVVLFGSAAEYGPVTADELPIREETPPRPTSAYGRSKLAQTRLAERYAAEHGLRVHVVRPFNLLGPGLGGQYFAAALVERLRALRRAGAAGSVPIANADATRDWVDVRDAVDAVVRLALDAPPVPGTMGLFNLATGVETTVLELADAVCRLAGDFHAVAGDVEPSRSAIARSVGDAARLRATGWAPRIGWRNSVRDLWADATSKASAA
jgi:GDP-4-dehydro-6-deoxy-D-mannose reductase